jgi:hypothetical protein
VPCWWASWPRSTAGSAATAAFSKEGRLQAAVACDQTHHASITACRDGTPDRLPFRARCVPVVEGPDPASVWDSAAALMGDIGVVLMRARRRPAGRPRAGGRRRWLQEVQR